MSERLYYIDSLLAEFDATVLEVRPASGDVVIVLDRTAFYPASGGQVSDAGWLAGEDGRKLRVREVAEDQSGEILHIAEAPEEPTVSTASPGAAMAPGSRVHGSIDLARRRDHVQQHSGQHVLSAAFVRLFQMATVSFHMGEYVSPGSPGSPAAGVNPKPCTIDLHTSSLSEAQAQQAEDLANAVVMEDRPVAIRFAAVDEARAMGVRKIPPELTGELRLIDIRDFDLTACGGTHVRSTGQIGPILLRKTERVKQGVRVEFVCGGRALFTMRRDYAALADAAGAYSTHPWDVPQQVRKSLEEIRSGQKEKKRLLEELAELHAARLLAEAPDARGLRLVTRVFADRDAAFIKLVAQKLTAASATAGPAAVALLGSLGGAQPALVFAQTPGSGHDMGALMKHVLAAIGGRGGGNGDMAQGGAPAGADIATAIAQAASKLRG